MSASIEQKVVKINELNALINEARARGDNVSQLENDRDELQAEVQRMNHLVQKGGVLKG